MVDSSNNATAGNSNILGVIFLFGLRLRQGAAFAAELVEAGAAQALMPLLHPRFELIRIEGLVRAIYILYVCVEREKGRGGERRWIVLEIL